MNNGISGNEWTVDTPVVRKKHATLLEDVERHRRMQEQVELDLAKRYIGASTSPDSTLAPHTVDTHLKMV